MTPRLPSRLRGSDGTALVEFTLILPLFLMLLFGIIDFGRAYSASVTLTNAVREGARYGITGQTAANIQSRTKTAAGPYNDGNLTVTVTNAQGTAGTSLVVQGSYQFSFLTPLVGIAKLVSGGTLPSTLTLTSSADMRIE